MSQVGIRKLWYNGLTQLGPWVHLVLYERCPRETHLEQGPLGTSPDFHLGLSLE